MIRLELITKRLNDKQTIGHMDVYKNEAYHSTFATLEQEWNNNEISNSCLPPGFHIVLPYHSKKHPNSFILEDTAPRTKILIHVLNFMYQTEGCIGLGLYHDYIDDDKYIDLVSSGEAMKKFRRICEGEKTIFINIKR